MKARLLCGILLLVLTGCAQAVATPFSELPTPEPTLPPPTPTPEPFSAQPLIVTLRLWLPEELDPYDGAPGAQLLALQLAEFSRTYPDLQVEVVVKKAHGRGGLLDFLRTARDAAPSVLPDLIVLDAGELETAARLGLLQPLDPLAPTGMSERFPFASEMGEVGDSTYGLILGVDLEHLAYRTQLLDAPPISWTQPISPPVHFIFPAGGKDHQVNDATLIQYLAAGGRLTDAANRPSLDQEALLSVLQFYQDCVTAAAGPQTVPMVITPPPVTATVTATLTSGTEVISSAQPVTVMVTIPPPVSIVLSPTLVLSIQDADQAWEMFKHGVGDIAVVRAGRFWSEGRGDMGAAPIPTRYGRPFTIVRRGWAMAMVSHDDPARQKLALLLLNWLIAPEHNGRWSRVAGYLPATHSALREWRISDRDRSALRRIMEAAVPPPPDAIVATVGPVLQEAVEEVLLGQASPEEAAARAVQRLK
ncbi:MAG: extracellular solute-binding protein [Anaerolineae bacterium]|nr:extracellular solute-binding protein [Anaerolineae bacterium]